MENSAKKIIVFDDDEDILSICSFILEEHGWEVFTFNNCKEIVEKVTDVYPDIILMDNWIPDIGGIKATQALKNDENLKNIPVIYFSANSDIEALTTLAGADAFLAKPFDLEDLGKIIEKTLRAANPAK